MFDTTHAACKGKLNLFFNERNRRQQAEAKTICRGCPIREECADWAMKNHIFYGIWGGYNSKEIEAQRRMRKIVLSPHYGYTRARKGSNA